MLIRKQKYRIEEAESFENGILFHSKTHKDYISLVTVEGGKIKGQWTTYSEYKKNMSIKEKRNRMKQQVLNLLFILPLTIGFFKVFLNIFLEDMLLGMRFFYIGLACLLLVNFISNILIETKLKRTKYRKFHAAEHMVIMAYNDLKRIPDIHEILRYSKYSNSCGTNATLLLVATFIVFFISSYIKNTLIAVICFTCSVIVILLLYKHGILNGLQKFTTENPTATEIMVAREGLKVWVKNEYRN